MFEDQPLVSILIPLYNAESWIADTIASALNQTWPQKEIIVVDDGSTDDSLSVAGSIDAPELTVLTQENQGACAARNRAFKYATGDYIQYLDADDLMAPNKIETQVRRLEAEPPQTVAYTRWGVFEKDPSDAVFEAANQTWRDYSDPVEWLLTWASSNGGARQHAWLVPRSLVEKAGPWNEDLRINQDGEFFSRVLLQSNGIAFCTDTEVYYRSKSRGVSMRRDRESWISLYRSYEVIFRRILDSEDSERTRKLCASKWENFKHSVYPVHPDLARKAEKKIDRLGGTDYDVGGSSVYLIMESLLGWKAARYIQDKYRRLVYK